MPVVNMAVKMDFGPEPHDTAGMGTLVWPIVVAFVGTSSESLVSMCVGDDPGG